MPRSDESRRKSIEYVREWRKRNPEKSAASSAASHAKYRDDRLERMRKWHAANKERHRITSERWRKANPEKDRESKRRSRQRLEYKLARALRTRMRDLFRSRSRPASALRLLGCTVEDLKAHLESQFHEGMSWGNYGQRGWHIDHIVPLSILDLSDPCEVARGCHYSNLQPLWASHNQSKGARKSA